MQTSRSTTRHSTKSPIGWYVGAYAVDWLVTIGITYFADMIKDSGIPGFKREFDLNDKSLQHTLSDQELVPKKYLELFAIALPLVLMPLVNVLTVQSLLDWHHSSLGLTLSIGLTGTITNILKVTVGRPRPDFIARCIPTPGSTNSQGFGLSNYTVCTQKDYKILRDAFRSFPSGHSSLSFAGFGFLSLYLAGKLRLFKGPGHPWKAWLTLTPLMAGVTVSVAMTTEYRHHWDDVVVGSLLGLAIAVFSYRQFYPGLTSSNPQLPCSPRRPAPERKLVILPTHNGEAVVGGDQPLITRSRDGVTYGSIV